MDRSSRSDEGRSDTLTRRVGCATVTKRSHKIIRGIAAILVYGSYRTVELCRPEADLSQRLVIIVANHFAGFANPVLMVMYGLQRRR